MCSQSCSVLDVTSCGDVHSGLFYMLLILANIHRGKLRSENFFTPYSSVSGLYEMSQGGNTCNIHLL